jgi:serine/threonine-protein phosphatase 2A activator
MTDSPTTPGQTLEQATLSDPGEMTDFYTLSLHRLTRFKRGASFSEHSPLLHQLSTFPDWKKPHAGLRKMFLGEVVGKRVVVQGLWIGGWCWGDTPPEGEESRRKVVEEANAIWGR